MEETEERRERNGRIPEKSPVRCETRQLFYDKLGTFAL